MPVLWSTTGWLTQTAPPLNLVSTGMRFEEAERLLVELGDALVNRRVRAGFEHDDFTALDVGLQRLGEAGRGDEVMPAEGDLVGAEIRPSWLSASWAMTASDWRMKASSGCFGRLRTKAASWSI